MTGKNTSILILGKTGQLAQELARANFPENWRTWFADRNEIDLADPDNAAKTVRHIAPDLVINAAAYTAVDRAESEPDLARRVNALSPGAVASACTDLRIPFVTVSTDYVFDGSSSGAYLETDPVAPLGVYGSTKEEGERLVRQASDKH